MKNPSIVYGARVDFGATDAALHSESSRTAASITGRSAMGPILLLGEEVCDSCAQKYGHRLRPGLEVILLQKSPVLHGFQAVATSGYYTYSRVCGRYPAYAVSSSAEFASSFQWVAYRSTYLQPMPTRMMLQH